MTERDRRIIEAMIGEADDWHIVDPETGAEIDQDGGIPVTPEQFKSLLAGESAVVGLTRRVVTLADGPFSIQQVQVLVEEGGPGSGFKGHKGRPGEVGGSEASVLGPKEEEHKPVKSKRKGQATSKQARVAAKRVADLMDTILAEAQAGGETQAGSWAVLARLARRAAWKSPDATTQALADSSPLTNYEMTNLWLTYHGMQHLLETSGLGDGLDADEHARIQQLGDVVGDFEPSLSGPDIRSEIDPAGILTRYLGDESTPGYLPEEITSDPYLRYQAGRIIANCTASVGDSNLPAYNGTEDSYLDIDVLSQAAALRGGSDEYEPEALTAVIEAWGRRAIGGEATPEAASAIREAPMDPEFWAQNQVMEMSVGQWLPTDVTSDLVETADFLNAGWKASPQGSAGGIAIMEAASRVFGQGTVPSREVTVQEVPDVERLDNPQVQERANRVVQGMYDSTQAWLADRGYHPGDTVRLYRGMGNIQGTWNPHRGPGDGNLQMFAVSSWSFDSAEAEQFADNSRAAIVAADIPIERLLANSDTGVPCENEGEWLVLGLDGIRGRIYRADDPPAAWLNDLDPTMSLREIKSNLLAMRSAVCLGFLPVSVPAQVITAQGWREIAARQATAPDASLPTIDVEADGDWIGNKLGMYGLTRADVDGEGQVETGKETAQKGQETGKPGDEEKAKGKEGGAPNKEAGLRAYARAKRANRVRRERARAAGRQRLQSGVPPVIERQYSGVGGRTTLGPEPTGWEVGKKYEVEGDSYYTLERWFYREPNKGQVYTVDYPVHVTVHHTGGVEVGGRYYYPRSTKTLNYGQYVSNPDLRGGPGWHYVSDRSPNFISPLTGNTLYGRPMTARLNPDIGCTASCMNAKRDECECSCGGANHGAGHLVQRGGEGSGHFGHKGRPGQVGGSLPSGEVTEEAVPMQVAELPLSANINRPGSAREFIRRRMQERLGKDVTSGHGEIMELYDSVRQKAPSMLWFREPGGAVLAVGVADAGSYGWPPTKIALGGLFAKPEGTGLGTAFMEALRDYADAAHKEIEVWAVANQRFFNRFGWLTPDKGNYPSSYYYMSPGRLADREGYEPHWMEQARQEGRYHGE